MVCHKKKYRSKERAANALAKIEKLKKLYPNRQEKRYYYCKFCRAWHLTSQAEPMTYLHIDIETRCSRKLDKVGLFKYLESPDFTILLFGYRINRGPVVMVDLFNGEEIPKEVFAMLFDPTVVKKAFNAQFEIRCLERHFLIELDPAQWRCIMVKCAMLGLPMNLEDAGAALNIESQKEFVGKSLIRIFSIPKKGGTYNQPKDFPKEWQQFKHYCGVDVLAEYEVDERTDYFRIPDYEQNLWTLDQRINAYGVEINPVMVQHAFELDAIVRTSLMAEAIQLTGLANPNSTAQLKEWLELEIDDRIPNLRKESVHELLKDCDEGKVKRVLQIRQQLSKSSIKKYRTALAMVGVDIRCKGNLQYYGALRTGRWAGRLLQVHNFPKNSMPNLKLARDLLIAGEYDLMRSLWDNIPYVLSQLLRTMFVPGKGKKFVMADFSSIEARVIAWLAGETWRLQAQAKGIDLYVLSAASVFNKPVSECGKGTPYRDSGKVYELALGFQGSVGAVRRMDDKKVLITKTDEDILRDVRAWRNASPNIRQMWYDTQNTAIECVQTGKPTKVKIDPESGLGGHGAIYKQVLYFMSHGSLYCKLPSGRCLSYVRPVIKEGENGFPQLWYLGIDPNTHQWKMIPTYGGKLIENIVQAMARDLLSEKMFRVADLGYAIPFHVHDELIIEVLDLPAPHLTMTTNFITKIMGEPISWAAGLPLAADAYASDYYYKKD